MRPSIILHGVLVIASGVLAAGVSQNPRPKVTLRVTPAASFAPAKLLATAELIGGANDFEEYYCAKTEWVWADGTTSESQDDCTPYQRGHSEIRRRFTHDHTYKDPGRYELNFLLKQGKKTVAFAKLLIEVSGLRDAPPSTPLRAPGRH